MGFSVLLILASSALCATIFYDDPIKLGIGARPIGMGKAFTAVADDSNALFINPAGLGNLYKWNIASMNTSFMDTYQYMVLGLAYPTNDGTYGFGYVSTKVGQIPWTGGTTGETFDYENRVVLLTYSKYVGDYMYDWLGKEEEIYAGASFKLFSKGYCGAVSANGTGMGIDLSMKYTPYDWVSYGVNMQNIIPVSLSGSIAQEDIPLLVKTGVAFKVLNDNVLIAIDKDMYFTRSVPWPLHVGAEWTVNKSLTLRGGFDQTLGSDSGMLATNPTLGVGLNLNGFTLDFAYRVDFEKTGSTSNFLSFTIQGKPVNDIKERKKRGVKEKPKEIEVTLKPVIEKVAMTLPKDRQYTYEFKPQIQGKVDPDVAYLDVEGKRININTESKFDDYYALKPGKNRLIFTIKDLGGKQESFERRIIRLYAPQGIAMSEIQAKPLDQKIATTLISDYLDREYKINEKLTRSTLAVLISKAQGYKVPVVYKEVSIDVGAESWTAPYIRSVLDQNIMILYSDGSFRPNTYVTRSEFLRVMSLATSIPLDKLKDSLASDDLGGEATIADTVAVMFSAKMFQNGIEDYIAFLGLSADEASIETSPQVEAVSGPEISVTAPRDKLVTFNNFVDVSGRILGPNVVKIEVNGGPVEVVGGIFGKSLALNIGRNNIVIEGRLKDGKISSITRRMLRIPLPSDVAFEEREKLEKKPSGYKVAMYVISEIIKEPYNISDQIKRGKFCKIAYDIKGMNEPESPSNVATDVPYNYNNAKEIRAMLRTGAMKLKQSQTFKPEDPILRSDLLEAVAVMQGVDLAAASEFFEGPKDLSQPAEIGDMIQLFWKSEMLKDRIAKVLPWEMDGEAEGAVGLQVNIQKNPVPVDVKYYKVVQYSSTFVDANALAKKMESSGFSAYIKKENDKWRVQIGSYDTEQTAGQAVQKLKAKGFNPLIIQE